MLLKQTFHWWLLFISVFALSACGFQLRGQASVPSTLHTITLTMNTGSANFERDIRIALSQAGIRVIDSANAVSGTFELKVNPLISKDTVLARAADNDATQIEKRLSATYFLRDESGKAAYGPRTLSTSIMLSNQDAEQSTKSAYNEEMIARAESRLANELVYDLSHAPL